MTTTQDSKYFVYMDEFLNICLVEPEESTLSMSQTAVDGLITYVPGSVDGFSFDIIVNDEGLFRRNFIRNNFVSYFANTDIVGPAILAKHDGEGNTIPFTIDEIKLLKVGEEMEIDWTPARIADIKKRSEEYRSNFWDVFMRHAKRIGAA